MNIENELSKIRLAKKYYRNGIECFFDPYRKKLIQITAEEIVRQKVAKYFIDDLGVPKSLLLTEQHLKHHNGSGTGRMDIVIQKKDEEGSAFAIAIIECKSTNFTLTSQNFLQVQKYANDIFAEFVFITNGIEIEARVRNEDNINYVPLKIIPTYEEMLNSQYVKSEDIEISIERTEFIKLNNVNYLREIDCYSFIGEDTPDNLIPSIVNIAECLLDTTHKFPVCDYGDFKVVQDIGVRYLGYGDASGSDFGTGWYRTLLIEDENNNNQLISFGSMCTGKTKDDPKYGNSTGRSVLVVSLDNFDKDSMIVQINLNRSMHVYENKTIITHNGSVVMKSAKSGDLKRLVFEKHKGMIQNNQIYLGELINTELLYMDTPCMVDFIVNLIQYTFIRNKYKESLSQKKRSKSAHA